MPRTRRRSKIEIFIDVLEVIKDGVSKPTRIMYGTNLSWQPLMRVLRSMVDQGLVKEIDSDHNRTPSLERKRDRRTTKLYEITMKGEEVVKYFRGAGSNPPPGK